MNEKIEEMESDYQMLSFDYHNELRRLRHVKEQLLNLNYGMMILIKMIFIYTHSAMPFEFGQYGGERRVGRMPMKIV